MKYVYLCKVKWHITKGTNNKGMIKLVLCVMAIFITFVIASEALTADDMKRIEQYIDSNGGSVQDLHLNTLLYI